MLNTIYATISLGKRSKEDTAVAIRNENNTQKNKHRNNPASSCSGGLHGRGKMKICSIYLPPSNIVTEEDLKDLLEQLQTPMILLGQVLGLLSICSHLQQIFSFSFRHKRSNLMMIFSSNLPLVLIFFTQLCVLKFQFLIETSYFESSLYLGIPYPFCLCIWTLPVHLSLRKSYILAYLFLSYNYILLVYVSLQKVGFHFMYI